MGCAVTSYRHTVPERPRHLPPLRPFSQTEVRCHRAVANLALFKKGLPYIYRGHREARQGQPCRVLVRANKNRCLVEFADGLSRTWRRR
jgi:hypothetical protein